jgi:hypothetical protein
MEPINSKIAKRFFSKFEVTLSGCWRWNAASNGYGRFSIFGESRYAHIVSWYIHYGSWPTGFVCHSCDNPLCVNPGHLFEGSPKDNTHDALYKGRRLGAPRKHDPQEIRQLLARGLSQREVSKLTGASQATVSEVNRWVRS